MATTELTYLQTHPWLTFRVDLQRAPTELWLLLGEASSKIQHIGGSLLRPDEADKLHRLYLAKGALATTAIEGNTLSEDEALAIVDGTLHLPPSQEYLAQEVRNIVDACNQIMLDVMVGEAGELTPELLSDFNRRVLVDLELEEGVVAGQIRTHSVTVGRYRGAPAGECEYLHGQLCEWLAGPAFTPPNGEWIVPFAILKAVIAHLYLAWIHAYGDGNGRTARLTEFQILLSAGVPTPAAHLLSNHYNQTRAEYYRRLDTASRSDSGPIEFVTYAVQGFRDGLRQQLAEIRSQQFQDRFEQYVYETFGEARKPSERRQRQLVLELGKKGDVVPVRAVTSLSTELASFYAGRTSKTLTRDINAVLATGLVVREPGGLRAKRELVLAFVPLSTVGGVDY